MPNLLERDFRVDRPFAKLGSDDGYTLECPNSSIVARYGDTLVPLIRVLVFCMAPRNVRCLHGRFRKASMRSTRSCHLLNCAKPTASIWCMAVG